MPQQQRSAFQKTNLALSLLTVPVPLLAGFVQHPGVGERGLPRLLRLLLVLVHGALVHVAQEVEQMAHQRAFACVHMTCTEGDGSDFAVIAKAKTGEEKERNLVGTMIRIMAVVI